MEAVLKQIAETRPVSTHQSPARSRQSLNLVNQPFDGSQIYHDPDTYDESTNEQFYHYGESIATDRASEAAQGRARLSLPQPGTLPAVDDGRPQIQDRIPTRNHFEGLLSHGQSTHTSVTRHYAREPLQPLAQPYTSNRETETESSSPFFIQSSPTPIRGPQGQAARGLPNRDTYQSANGNYPFRTFHDDIENLPLRAPARTQTAQPSTQLTILPRSSPGTTITAQGIPLIPVCNLPDRFSSIFPYRLFNAVQSKCFSDVIDTDDNFVMSAPTGSGKTVILELAIVRLVMQRKPGSFKVVYVAPTKALCSEKYRDWSEKFRILNMKCAELTGDKSTSDSASLLISASIVVTTPEKWDSVSRKMKDIQPEISLVKLMLIDEVHMLQDSRGATLEAIVSRMKLSGIGVRFIALSATVPNADDVAKWIGASPQSPSHPATLQTFGEGFRPVRLEKHVYGMQQYSAGNGGDWQLDERLTTIIPKIIDNHGKQQPILIFCSTRSACIKTAKFLTEKRGSHQEAARWWVLPAHPTEAHDDELTELLSHGVAVHHAGLEPKDRILVEEEFLKGRIAVICCTSTLAVGVNTPCHMVIIKNTMTWTDEGLREYSDLEMMQMMGRAGRPQYQSQGAVAVILTCSSKVEKYEILASGQRPLESTLHLGLLEHLNAEISSGTIGSVSDANKWLESTFLYVRLQVNPQNYKLPGRSVATDLNGTLQGLCQKSINDLHRNRLVIEDQGLRSTPQGEAMARFCVQFKSMMALLRASTGAGMFELLSIIVQAEEFHSVRFQANADGSLYKNLNSLPGIRFPLNEVKSSHDKRSLIIQAELGQVELPKNIGKKARQRYTQAKAVLFKNFHRLIRCVIDCKLAEGDAEAVRDGLQLARSVSAKVWDDWPDQLRQLTGVGPVICAKLVNADIKGIADLAAADPARLNMLFGKSKIGEKLVGQAGSFPRPTVTISEVDSRGQSLEGLPIVKFSIQLGFMNSRPPLTFNHVPTFLCLLVERSDGLLIDFRRMKAANCFDTIYCSTVISACGQKILCRIACDEFAGTAQCVELTPQSAHGLLVNVDPKQGGGLKCGKTGSDPAVSSGSNLSPPKLKAVPDIDMFGLDDLDERDLLTAEKQSSFRRIEDFEAGRKQPTRASAPEMQQRDEPHHIAQRADKRYACKHTCKNKGQCSHKCCKEGMAKPPKPSRTKLVKPATGKDHHEKSQLKQPSLLPLESRPELTGYRADKIISDDSLSWSPSQRPTKRLRADTSQKKKTEESNGLHGPDDLWDDYFDFGNDVANDVVDSGQVRAGTRLPAISFQQAAYPAHDDQVKKTRNDRSRDSPQNNSSSGLNGNISAEKHERPHSSLTTFTESKNSFSPAEVSAQVSDACPLVHQSHQADHGARGTAEDLLPLKNMDGIDMDIFREYGHLADWVDD